MSRVREEDGPSPRRRVYLMRHGEVSYFDSDGRPFRPDLVPLNDQGCRQAKAAAETLASVSLDRVITSAMPRSDETAAIIAAGRGLAVENRPALREIRPGRLAEIPTGSLQHAFRGAFVGLNRETRFLGGEHFGSLLDRVLACFDELVAEHTWRHLLIVAHGGVNRAILCRALGPGLEGFGRIEQDAGCINIIDVEADGTCLVRLINHTPYNPAKVGLELTTMERLFREYHARKGAAPGHGL